MDINTSFSVTSGSSAAAATVVKRQRAHVDGAAVFTPLTDEPVRQENTAGDSGQDDGVVISTSEKRYFESLFPNSADAIRSYSPYQRNGMRPSAGLGRLVDVKG